ncbi:MAG: response regulator transcription factor [Microgenomates group bacterium]
MKILVVEDEHRIANYIKKGLELQQHVVDIAYDGNSGYDFASAEKYDVIILDLMLPGKDGITICKELRKDSNHTPILMLTAKSSVPDRVSGLDAGADDYLPKPFAFTELLARVKALGRRPRQVSDVVLTAGTLSLNTHTQKIERSGQEISLSKKEFALLEFFMRHQNQILSKDQLTEQVWSYDSDVLPNTAQVYVGYLRNKIDRPFPNEEPLLHTSRGFGYTFGTNVKKV